MKEKSRMNRVVGKDWGERSLSVEFENGAENTIHKLATD